MAADCALLADAAFPPVATIYTCEALAFSGSGGPALFGRFTDADPGEAVVRLRTRVGQLVEQLDSRFTVGARQWLRETEEALAATEVLLLGRPYRFELADDQAVYVFTVEPIRTQVVADECLVSWRSGSG